MPDRREWYALDPASVLVAALFGTVVVCLFGWMYVRGQLARMPEIGRATPIEELRAAWAEADREEELSRRVPVTMPQSRPESRP